MARGALKGHPKWGGRRAGSPNKINADIKGMIVQALSLCEGAADASGNVQRGGVPYLLKQSEANPVAFLGLVGRVLPLVLAGDPNAPLFVVTAPAQVQSFEAWQKQQQIEHKPDLIPGPIIDQ